MGVKKTMKGETALHNKRARGRGITREGWQTRPKRISGQTAPLMGGLTGGGKELLEKERDTCNMLLSRARYELVLLEEFWWTPLLETFFNTKG